MSYTRNHWLYQHKNWTWLKPEKDIQLWEELSEVAEKENWPKKRRDHTREAPTPKTGVIVLGRKLKNEALLQN
jgi:hypothetical protein